MLSCLSVCLLICYWFCGVTTSSFYIFYTFSMFIIFQLKAISSCSNTQKAVSDLQMSNSKACHRRFNAKSNVHSMNNIRVPETFSISVCYQICFSAVRACCGSKPGETLTDRSPGWFLLRRLYFTQTSELCLFLCNTTQREKLSADHCIGIKMWTVDYIYKYI